MDFPTLLSKLVDRESLNADEMRFAIRAILEGDSDPVHVGSFLTALRLLGESTTQIVAAAQVMREFCVRPEVHRTGILDTCGTGGAPAPTFNVSTACAIVVSACGVPVAKHGNRSFSSPSGSADLLTSLGVDIEAPRARVVRSLEEIGLAFFFAPLWHPAMRHVAAVRKSLRFRTIFNLVGPLANPARAEYQLIGAGKPAWAEILAEAMVKLGAQRAAVVCSDDGLDEVSLSAPTEVLRVDPSGVSAERWTAEDFGLKPLKLESVCVASREESAAMVRDLLEGKRIAARDLVLANSAAALLVTGTCDSLKDGVERAAAAIDDGSSMRQAERLAELSRTPVPGESGE